MADLKISELSALAGSNLVAADALAIVDDSASETKKITVSDLIANGVTVISDDTIPGAKILFGAGDIATAALADAAVTTAKVADDAITAAKLGNESTVDLVTTLPGAGAFTGQLAFDTDDNKLYVWDGSAWKSLKAAGSVNTVSGSTTGEINIVSSVSGDTVTLSATIDNTSSANQFLAGPTGAAGAVGYRVIDGSDLPVSTSSAKGGVIVNGEGLRMDANTIEVNNDVTASSTHHVVTYDAKGLITGGRVLAASDLPIATASAVGGVIASTGLTVDGSGNLTINNTVTADTYTKVTVAATGLVTAGSNLAASDLPNHSADLLTSGNIPLARIADNLITGAKLADYASAKIGETNPTADYIGQLFFNPLTRDLSLWDGNVFQPIGISAGEIVFAGTYNATTNLVSSVTSDGTGAGYVVGQALPAASNTNKNFYVVVDVGGTGTSPAPAVALAPPDFVLSTGTEYKLIDVSETVTAQVASNVGFTPVGTIAANNVQTALAEVDTEKLAKSGGTMTGNLELNDANVVFEGSTENAFETTLTVVDPTADRTITLPNVTGAVVTTGDTGTVTSTMLTDGTIVNADINASAEIAVSKLANGTARQLLQTDSGGSGVEFTSNVDVPGTLDVTGAATLDSTLGVAGLISANGKVSFPLGSAAAPSLLPGADTNTGIFSPGADALAITTAGTQRVTVDSSGKVGIGTTSPTANLHGSVSSGGFSTILETTATSGESSLVIGGKNSSGTVRKLFLKYDNSDIIRIGTAQAIDLRFETSDTERLRIDSSGNLIVGGTATSSTNAAYISQNGVYVSNRTAGTNDLWNGKLNGTVTSTINADGSATFVGDPGTNGTTVGTQISSTGLIRVARSSDGPVFQSNKTDSSGYNVTINADGSAEFSGGDIKLHSYGGSEFYYPTSGTSNTIADWRSDVGGTKVSVVTFKADGRVGIGTTSPSAQIEIEGNVSSTTQFSGFQGLRVQNANGAAFGVTADINFVAGTASGNRGAAIGVEYMSGSKNDLYFATSGGSVTSTDTLTERMRIDSSGNVTLGYAGNSLHFQNGFNNSTSRIQNGGGSNSSDFKFLVKNSGSESEAMRIDSSGKIGIGVTSPSQLLEIHGSSSPCVLLKDTTNNVIAYTFADDSVANFGSASNHPVVFRVNNQEKARIDSSGRLLIGTTTEGLADGDNLTIADSGSCGITLRSGSSSGGAIYFSDATSGSGEYAGFVEYLHNDNALRFASGGAERMRILSGGGLTFNGDTAQANALDDYEEGNGTPTVGFEVSGTATIGAGASFKYVKTGDLVTFSFEFSLTAASNPAGGVKINLPFASGAGVYSAGAVRLYNVTFTGSPFLQIGPSSSHVVVLGSVSGTSNSQINDPGFYFGTISYRTSP